MPIHDRLRRLSGLLDEFEAIQARARGLLDAVNTESTFFRFFNKYF
jgi:hypothetical protein